MEQRENALPVFMGADSLVYEWLLGAYSGRGSDNRFFIHEMSYRIPLLMQDTGLSTWKYIQKIEEILEG